MVKLLVNIFAYLCLYMQCKCIDASDNSEVTSVLNKREINIMLETHNDYRRSVNPSASNMRRLSWNEKLANLAQAYANRCVFRHSETMAMDPYGYIAESIYIGNERFQTFSDAEVARPVASWYNESVFYDFNQNKCQEGQICGHYTQAVWYKTYHLGCGRTRCSGNVPVGDDTYANPIIVVCKYGPAGNRKKMFQKKPRRPYSKGEWCSHCPEEAPVCIDKLCDIEGSTTAVITAPASTIVTTNSSVPTAITSSTNTSTSASITTMSSTSVSTVSKSSTTSSTTSSTSVSTVTTTSSTPMAIASSTSSTSASTAPTTSASTTTASSSVFEILGPPLELPVVPKKELITVNFIAVDRPEVENVGPVQRSVPGLRRTQQAGLNCYLCSGGSSVAQCISKNETMLCEDDDDLTSALGSNENDWSCAKYNKGSKVAMKCMPTAKCKQMKEDEDSNADCCHTDFCNHAKATRSVNTILSLTNIFILLLLLR